MDVNIEEVEHLKETKITGKATRRTTVPKYIAEKLGLSEGDRIVWIVFKNGSITIAKQPVSAGAEKT
jgi:AbrB family looped-hinge helix DNA binding protein